MIALTGAAGFVGSAVVAHAAVGQVPLAALVRRDPGRQHAGCVHRVIGDFAVRGVDPASLAGCQAVIHAAARAHRMDERGASALADYRQVNVGGTRALIEAMVQARVHRLVYVSSIKVVGERSQIRPLTPDMPPAPEDPYGISKREAEAEVQAAHADGRIEAVIIRPVLVHGPGARGNLERMMEAIRRRRPLPLGGVRNRRSMVGVGNLAEALLRVATTREPEPAAAAKAYHIADDGVISVRRLVEVLAEGMGVQPRLLDVPRWLVFAGATLCGRRAVARRLFDDLEVDGSAFRRDFSWKPAITLEDGLRQMAAAHVRAAAGDTPR